MARSSDRPLYVLALGPERTNPSGPISMDSLLNERLVEQLLKDDDDTLLYGKMSSDFTEWEQQLAPVLLQSTVVGKYAKQLATDPYFTKQTEWLRQTQVEQRKLYAIGAIVDKAMVARVEASLKNDSEIGPSLRGRLKYQGDSFDCADEPVFVDHVEGQGGLSSTHFCMAEARLAISGRECVIALPYAQIGGDNFTQKSTFLHSLTLERAFALASKVGFLRILTPGSILIILAGYVVVSVTIKQRFPAMGPLQHHRAGRQAGERPRPQSLVRPHRRLPELGQQSP